MKRKYFFFALFATVAMSFGCSREYNLEQTIFIYDPEFQDLPIYSEWGYNTFGAYYDREAFISLYDGVGNRLSTMVDQELTPGKYSLALPPVTELEPGVYHAVLKIQSSLSAEPIVEVCKFVVLP